MIRGTINSTACAVAAYVMNRYNTWGRLYETLKIKFLITVFLLNCDNTTGLRFFSNRFFSMLNSVNDICNVFFTFYFHVRKVSFVDTN